MVAALYLYAGGDHGIPPHHKCFHVTADIAASISPAHFLYVRGLPVNQSKPCPLHSVVHHVSQQTHGEAPVLFLMFVRS